MLNLREDYILKNSDSEEYIKLARKLSAFLTVSSSRLTCPQQAGGGSMIKAI